MAQKLGSAVGALNAVDALGTWLTAVATDSSGASTTSTVSVPVQFAVVTVRTYSPGVHTWIKGMGCPVLQR